MALIHLDAGVVIGFLDANDGHHTAARRLLDEATASGDHLAIAASALAECLVGPARTSEAAVQTVSDLIDRLPIDVVTIDVELAVAAARLRAQHRSLRLPDALVVAAAVESQADQLATTDRKWPSAKKLGLMAVLRHV